MKEVQGDLITMFKQRRFDYIAHGCNCFHTMGSGIARSLSKEFPEILAEDKKTRRGDKTKLGQYTKIKTEYGIILNLYTQYRYGYGLQVDYSAIEKGFKKLNKDIDEDSVLGIPMIGAGLAGGDWNKIKSIISTVYKKEIIIVKYNRG